MLFSGGLERLFFFFWIIHQAATLQSGMIDEDLRMGILWYI